MKFLSSPSPRNEPPSQERGRFEQWLFSLAVATARRGQVPAHVAYILDGNRRWGRHRGLSLRNTYLAGWGQLKKYVELCTRCGVRAMSLYVFSVENFKRSDEEVGTILDIVIGGLSELVQLAHDLDASIRICGQRELVSPRVLERLEEAAESTRHNQSAIVNICFAYASTAEIRTAIQCSVRERLAQEAAASDTTFDTVAALDRNMYTVDSPPLDLLIRTGSTHRLSDFLLWQCHQDTSIVFVKKAWPELSIPRVLAILIEWRQNKSPPPPTISKA